MTIKPRHSSEEQLVTLRFDLLTPLTGVLGASRLLMQIDSPPDSCVSAMVTIQAAAQSLVQMTHTLLAEYGVFGQRLFTKPIPPTPNRATQEASYEWAWSLPLDTMSHHLVAEVQIEIMRIADATRIFERDCHANASPQGAEVFRVLLECFERIRAVADSIPGILRKLLAAEAGTNTLADDSASPE